MRGPPGVGDADGVVEGLFVVEAGHLGVEGALLQLSHLPLTLDQDHAVGGVDSHTLSRRKSDK